MHNHSILKIHLHPLVGGRRYLELWLFTLISKSPWAHIFLFLIRRESKLFLQAGIAGVRLWPQCSRSWVVKKNCPVIGRKLLTWVQERLKAMGHKTRKEKNSPKEKEYLSK